MFPDDGPFPPRQPTPAPQQDEPRTIKGLRALIHYQPRTHPPIDINALVALATFQPMQDTMEYIKHLANASIFTQSKLSPNALHRLLDPPNAPVAIDDPAIRFSISTYLSLEHASQAAYNGIIQSFKLNFGNVPGVGTPLAFHGVENLIGTLTGVESILDNMCPNSCLGFTGPYSDLDACPICQASRWDEGKLQGSNGRLKVPAKQFTTIPLGPQLQARYRNPASASQMQYLYRKAQEILNNVVATGSPHIPVVNDIVMGWDFLGAVLDENIQEHDIVLMVSLDGAQLYDSKESDCWMYIWVIANLLPDICYHKFNVLPGSFIPGPKKPKNVDSFLFRGLHHLAAIQQNGLHIWNSLTNSQCLSFVYLLFTTGFAVTCFLHML